METKIFNRLLTVLALLMLSAPAFAQVNDTLPAPPNPPADYKLNKEYKQNKKFDKEKFKQDMANFKFKMADMSKQMLVMSENMALKMKDFDKKFKFKMKDFGKDFSGSFNGMVPDMGNAFNGNVTDDDYKRKLASGDYTEKIKTYTKTYSVDNDDELQITNSFGKVVVNTWNRKEFKVEVEMKFSSDNASLVDDMFNGTTVTDSKNGSTVSFVTKLWSNSKNSDTHIAINYTVYMPAGNPLNISNKFGSVILPDLSGRATLRVQFGNLLAQALTNAQNDVSLSFTQDNTSTISTFNGGKIKVQFGKLKAGTLNNMTGDFQFSNIDIDKLKGDADIRVKYKSLNIGAIDRSVRNLDINSQFTNVNLDFKDNDDFNFDVTSKMGGFDDHNDKIKITSKTPSDEERGYSSTKTYKGYIGRSGSDNKITINASFGRIRFN